MKCAFVSAQRSMYPVGELCGGVALARSTYHAWCTRPPSRRAIEDALLLKEIERISVALEGMLRQVPGTRSTFAERQTGREYVDIVPNREAIARYGLTVRDVQDVVEAAVGGMPVSTAIAGRARFSINLRYAADQRSDPQALRRILVPVQATGSGTDLGGLTLTSAVYCFSSSAQLTGTLTLDAQNNPNAVFVFQIGSTLTTASGANVVVINGGSASASERPSQR